MRTITLHRPNTLHNTLSDLDRYFESFFGEPLLCPRSKGFTRMPAVDVRETEKAYILDMELPGYEEKDIEVHVDGSSLSVASKQEEAGKANDGEQGTWLIRERQVQSFSRSFKMPENADPEGIGAEFKNGMLCMEIPKKPEAQKRAIQIKVR